MEQPKPLTYQTPYKTVVIEDPSGIKTMQGMKVLDGGIVVQNGKSVKLCVKIEGKPDLEAAVTEWMAEWDAYKSFKAAEFSANVPGLEELRKVQSDAYNDEHRYRVGFERMMEDEFNDGVNPPAAINETLRSRANTMAVQFPRAAIYLRAKSYTQSDNVNKYSAGKKAMEIISMGGSIEEAQNILENWLPESTKWD